MSNNGISVPAFAMQSYVPYHFIYTLYQGKEANIPMTQNYDVVVVGSGVAGLYAALQLDRSLSVLLLSKRELSLSNSSLAQGGIAAVIDYTNDTTDAHFNDTLIAGGFKNNPQAVRVLVDEGPDDVRKLIDLGVDFDRMPDGSIHFTLEGGHSKPRILHHKDATGDEMVQKLLKTVLQLENVTVWEHALVCELKQNGNFSLDVLKDHKHHTVNARFCLLATGGIGRVYQYTTNSKIATGDGIALADFLGANIQNLHYIQFHPTGFADKTRETFLISESVRGEGAYLLNCHGERFMHKYDERLELAPRDVVSRAILEEQQVTGSAEFYLDISYKDADAIRARFPMIHRNLLESGYDLTRDRIPVYPCHHYLMGGIDIDLNGKTSIDNLYAAGECSHSGVHGNNRLASNSLLEALVFSRRAAQDINVQAAAPQQEWVTADFPQVTGGTPIPPGIRTEVRAIMQQAHFVFPNKEAARAGFEAILALKKQLEEGHYQVDEDYIEARSLIQIAYLVLKEVI